jgi:hypothetical protein
MGLDTCWIIKYPRLSKGIYNDLSSYRQFFHCLYIWAAQLIRGAFHLGICFSCLEVLESLSTFFEVSAVSTRGAEDQEYCGSEVSKLKKLIG